MRLIADYDELDEKCCGTVNVLNGPSSGLIAIIGGQVLTEDPFARSQYYNYNPPNELENSGVSLQIDYDFGGVTLTSITSSRSQTRVEDADSDFTSADLLGAVLKDIDIDTFTQELRLTSSGDSAFDWMIGGFYFDDELTNDNTLSYGQDFRAYGDCLSVPIAQLPVCNPSGVDAAEAILGAAIPGIGPGSFQQAGTGFVEAFTQDNTSFSIFGQVDFHLGDRTTLTLGANYTEDEKDVTMNIDSTTDLFSSLDFRTDRHTRRLCGPTYGGDCLRRQPTSQDNPAVDATCKLCQYDRVLGIPFLHRVAIHLLPLQPFQFLPPFMNFPNGVEPGSTKDDDTTWTARLAFDATDSINIYIGAATGFKASSWNLTRDSRPFPGRHGSHLAQVLTIASAPPNLVSGTRYAGPEEAHTAYEIGLKGRFDRGSVNVAVFDQEIEGFQSALSSLALDLCSPMPVNNLQRAWSWKRILRRLIH